MSTLVDSHICPDCRAPLDAAATCTQCGLRLVGPAAAELWQHMVQADRLIEQLRAAPVATVTTAATVPGEAATVAATAAGTGVRSGRIDLAAPPVPPLRAARPALPSASVPIVLLTLGGLCLLIAAIVFVAVAWSSLGLAAKTLIMLAVTALFATGGVAATRRELRFASETLWLVVAGLVVLDLAAAYGADLFGLGRLGDRDAVGLVGGALLGLAVGVGAWATTTPLRRLHGMVVVAGAGTVLLAGAEAWVSDHNPTAVTLSVPVLAGLALGIDRLTDGHLRPTALVVGGTAVVSWLEVVGYGVDRMATTDTDRAWWTELPGWPLLAAAGLAAAVAAAPRLPAWLRAVCAGATLGTLALFGVGPSTGPTADLLAWAVVTVLVAAVAALAPLTWSRPAAALTLLGLLGWSLTALVRPLEVLDLLPTTARPDHADLGLHLPAVGHGPASWTAVVSALVVGAAAAGLLRHLPTAPMREAAGRGVIALGPGVLALGATTGFLETEPTLAAASLAWTATLALTAAMATTVRHHTVPLVASLLFVGYLVVVGLRLAVASHLLSAVLATLVALVLATAYARVERTLLQGLLRPGLAVATVVSAGYAGTHWPYLAGGRENAAGLCLAAVASVAVVLARPVGRDPVSRVAVEITGLVAGLVATAYVVDDTVAATVLTILGSAVALTAVLNRDRDQAAWIGVALLGVATALRLIEDVRAPEAYTLPAALVLVGAGWWRMTGDAEVGSVRMLSSGLTLGLLPSLLIALAEPVSLRGALIAAAGVVVLAVGVARLWVAPFAAGALTTAVLAVRHLEPVVAGLPRWISLGTLGLVLLLVGVTWEQRRRDLATAGRYLASLR